MANRTTEPKAISAGRPVPEKEDLSAKADLELLSDLSGYVYVDLNNNGVFDAGDTPLGGVVVTLTGTNWLTDPVTLIEDGTELSVPARSLVLLEEMS